MWKHKVKLGQWQETIKYGMPVRTIQWTTHFANKKAVRQTEFYAAANVGLRPEVVFEVYAHEYDGHEMLKYEDVEYAIMRTYENGDIIELVCTANVGDANG